MIWLPRFSQLFLSTPSVGRATVNVRMAKPVPSNFYPRPPWGGRRVARQIRDRQMIFLSTPSVGRATRRWCW